MTEEDVLNTEEAEDTSIFLRKVDVIFCENEEESEQTEE